MVQKSRSIVMIVVGIIALVLSFKCFSIEDLDYASKSMYGGDAYTGIQNAVAVTSKNVKELARIAQFGFGSVLFVMGLSLVGIGLTTPTRSGNTAIDLSKPMETNNVQVNAQAITAVEDKTKEQTL